ncbi:MAG: hypothetical protein K2Y37_04245 [Pirellulales bacterium]|nr:hypothetical protein [Pirellulales bacterium]
MRLYALICAVGLFVTAIGATPDHLDESGGTWKLVKAERDGKPLPKEQFDHDITLIVTRTEGGGIKYVAKKSYNVVTEATVQQHKAGDKYDQCDVTFSKGCSQGKTLRGILGVEGDTMTACWHRGQGYPKEFTGAKDFGCTLRILKRIADNDLAKLAGTWNLIALERDGKPAPKDKVADKLVITRISGAKSACHVLVMDRGKVRAEATIQPTDGAKDEKHDGLTYTRFNVTYSKGRHAGTTLHASIHVYGDALKAFWTIPDEGGEEATKTFHTFQRADDDLAQLPGTWKQVSAERDGKPLSKEEFAKYPNVLVITRVKGQEGECKVVMKMGDEVVAEAMLKRSAGEKGAKHNHYEAAYSKGRHAGTTLHATIDVDGDTLKACWTKPDEGGDGASKTCHTLQRVKQ